MTFDDTLSGAVYFHVADFQKASILEHHLFGNLPMVNYYSLVSCPLVGMSTCYLAYTLYDIGDYVANLTSQTYILLLTHLFLEQLRDMHSKVSITFCSKHPLFCFAMFPKCRENCLFTFEYFFTNES